MEKDKKETRGCRIPENFKKQSSPKKKLSFDQILKGIQNNTLFGLLIVDIHTPTELQPLFADHPRIIKNTMVSCEDIGDYMRGVAEKHGFLKKTEKSFNL